MDNSAIKLTNVSVSFGSLSVFNNLSLDIQKGLISGIMGPNGAGKSTLMNLISGYIVPEQGNIEISGIDITHRSVVERARLGLSRSFQNLKLIDHLTVFENLLIARRVFKPKENRVEACRMIFENFPPMLRQLKDQKVENLPYGVKKRLELSRMLLADPKILLLDEPAAGLTEAEKWDMAAALESYQTKTQVTILIIEHHQKFIQKICSHLNILAHGKIIASGSPSKVLQEKEVLDAYIG